VTLAFLNAADGFALSMVLILTLGLGVVALLLGSIARHGKRRDHELEALLDELRREDADQGRQAAVSTSPEPTAPREPWERDGDWWKK
jgi:hypothetical protein